MEIYLRECLGNEFEYLFLFSLVQMLQFLFNFDSSEFQSSFL